MRYLGLDYGAKRIGLALSSEGIAFPQGIIANDNNLFPFLREMVEREKVSSIVVGDTRTLGGSANPITKDAEAFMKRLAKETNLPVLGAREAESSREASRYVEETRDDAAAAIILQRYLDMRGSAMQ